MYFQENVTWSVDAFNCLAFLAKIIVTAISRINSTINIYPVTMIEGGLQLPVYEQIEASKEKDAFSKNRSQSCVFVFPDGSYGSTGFKRFIEKYVNC